MKISDSPSYCLSCMAASRDSSEICPLCGRRKAIFNDLHQLRAGTFLNGRYLVGRILGQGGFGITYIGRDVTLDDMVAIKEYYPSEISTRNNTVSSTVYVSNSTQGENYVHGKVRFLDEARTLRKFKKESGIVGVQDFFEANGTAYIIMEYLDGVTLREYVRRRGALTADETVNLMLPVISALCRVHDEGVIHRDISPENIMVLGDGSLKLLDFGAAREFAEDKSVSVMLKPGYAPVEQYRSRGNLGPWTDIYALCATMYFCMTGTPPDDSIERMMEDRLKYPSELGVNITSEQEEIIIRRGMSLNPDERWQSMDELGAALGAEMVTRRTDEEQKHTTRRSRRESEKPKPRGRIIAIAAAAVAVLACVIIGIAAGGGKETKKVEATPAPVETAAPSPTAEPLSTDGLQHVTFFAEDMSNSQFEKAASILEERIDILCDGTDYYMERDEDRVDLYADRAVLGTESSDLVYDLFLGMPMRMYIGTLDLINGQGGNGCVEITPGSVDDVLLPDDAPDGAKYADYADMEEDARFISFLFSDKFIKQHGDTIRSFGEDAIVYFKHPERGEFYCPIFSTSDRNCYYFTPSGWPDGLAQLLAFNLTSEDMPAAFTCREDIYAPWETEDSAAGWGEFQCEVGELEGECVTFSLSSYSEASDGELIDGGKILKSRLDIIGRPYAFCIYNADGRCHTVIKTSSEHMSTALMNIVGESFALETHVKMNTVSTQGAKLEKGKGGWQLKVSIPNYEVEEYAEFSQRCAEEGAYRVSITDDQGFPIMSGTMKDAFSTELYFDHVLLSEEETIGEDNLWVAKLVESVMNSSGDLPIYFDLDEYRLYDRNGAESSDMELGVNTKKILMQTRSLITAVYKAASVSEGDGNKLCVRLHLPVTDTLATKSTELIKEIYEAIDFESLPYSTVAFYLVDENNDAQERARVFFDKNYAYSADKTGYVYIYGAFSGGRLNAYRDAFCQIIDSDEFFTQFHDETLSSWW